MNRGNVTILTAGALPLVAGTCRLNIGTPVANAENPDRRDSYDCESSLLTSAAVNAALASPSFENLSMRARPCYANLANPYASRRSRDSV